MTGLSPATMTRLRRVDAQFMPSTCRVLRRESETDGGREVFAENETQVGPAVACRATSSNTRLPVEGFSVGRASDETQGNVALSIVAGVPDVNTTDRIEVTTGTQVTVFEVAGDPWLASYSTNLLVPVRRED